MTATFLLFVVALVLPPGDSQTWETSNDPDGLCTTAAGAKVTGYKATLDCRGYVYCADGYLMGGGAAGASPSGVSGGTGVIACWPNQLFDEASGTCRGWQDVDTSRCPRFDGSMMMPEDTDENANQERFFVSAALSQSRPTIHLERPDALVSCCRRPLCAVRRSAASRHRTRSASASPVPGDRASSAPIPRTTASRASTAATRITRIPARTRGTAARIHRPRHPRSNGRITRLRLGFPPNFPPRVLRLDFPRGCRPRFLPPFRPTDPWRSWRKTATATRVRQRP